MQTPPILTFRAARHDDHAAVVAMTRDIWGGDDYLPAVWHEWVDTPNSHLVVGLLGADVVVSGRLVTLAEGEWWLEGMRVHPAHQGQGLSSQLHDHLVEMATRQPGMRTLGLATSWRNLAIAHLARRSGMVQQGDYRMLKREGGGHLHPGVTVIDTTSSLLGRIAASAWGRLGGGYLMDGWVARCVTSVWIAELIARGERLWACGDALALAGPAARHQRWWLRVMVGGTVEEQRVLAEHIAQVAFQHTSSEPLRCLVPNDATLIGPLQTAGFGDPWSGDRGPFHIYHFVLTKT